MENSEEADICRVCRSEGTQDKPLFHPCVCTGSIKYIHQECLLQWLRHSRKEYCELCKHKFAFAPIYSPDMPSHLPLQDVFAGLVASVGTAIKYWFHFTLVAFAWLGLVPLSAYRIYKCLFTASVSSLITLPLELISTQNLLSDCLRGLFVVTCTLCTFIGLIGLREQIIHGGAPLWLEPHQLLLPVPILPNAPAPANEVPDGNDAPAAAADAGAQHPAGPAPDGLAPNNPHEAGNQGHEAEHDEEEDHDEEDDEEDAADAIGGQDLNWNALEWDRAAEELTWERDARRSLPGMLGLDGSLLFLEHVFWVVSLNSLFILVFAFCPYHIGHFLVVGLDIEEYVKASHFEGLITTILGYIFLAGVLIVCHLFASLVNFQRSRRLFGFCYIVVKVALLAAMELGLFPLICGWWLDICSLEMFDATLKDREQSFNSAPGTTMFLHWLVGIVYVFYFASFILLLREVLRPGVLWFLRNLNDPDFNPVQEMIHLPIYRHLRRLMFSGVVFGSIVLLMLWIPIKIIKEFNPTFLPYNVMLYSDAPVSELSLELLLLQVVLPALLEQAHTRQWLKWVIHAWTFTIGYTLDLHSYLLGGYEEAILQQGGPMALLAYHRPLHFPIKILLLLAFLSVTLITVSLLCLTLPVYTGRWLISLWLGSTMVHELYTVASGLYVCWLSLRAAITLLSWILQGCSVILLKVQEWTVTILKTLVVTVMLAGVVPLLLGLLFELIIVAPLRVPLEQTPLFYPWQDWALGVLHTKIIAAITLMGPQWWLRTVIEQVYANGIQNIDLPFIVQRLAAPVICILLLSLCVPYTISAGIIPLLGVQPEMQMLLQRRIYPFLLLLMILLVILSFQIGQFKRLYEHIKNDKYLVGQQLVNYDHKTGSSPSSSS